MNYDSVCPFYLKKTVFGLRINPKCIDQPKPTDSHILNTNVAQHWFPEMLNKYVNVCVNSASAFDNRQNATHKFTQCLCLNICDIAFRIVYLTVCRLYTIYIWESARANLTVADIVAEVMTQPIAMCVQSNSCKQIARKSSSVCDRVVIGR